MIARMAIDMTPTLTTQPPLSPAQGVLQRANLARQLLSPWAQAQLAATASATLPLPPTRPLPTLAQRIAQRFARNDALSVRHDRRLLRFAAAPQTPLPLARPFSLAQASPIVVDKAIEPEPITDVESSLWSPMGAVETTATLSERLPTGRSSLAAEITERIRRSTMGTVAPQPLSAAGVTASQLPLVSNEAVPLPASIEAAEDEFAQVDLAQHNSSIAALIRARIQRAEVERFLPKQSVAQVEAAQRPSASPEQAVSPPASVAALLRERIQRAQVERFTPQTETPSRADANQPETQPVSPAVSRPLSPPTFPAQTAAALSNTAWTSPETTAQTADASSVLPATRLPDLSSGETAPVFTGELPPQVRRMRAYSRVDLVATGVNRPLPQAEPAAGLTDPAASLPDVDDQTWPPSVAAPFAAPDEPLPTVQRIKAPTDPVVPQPPLLSPPVAQAPTQMMTMTSLAPGDQPTVDPEKITEETTTELPVASGTSGAALWAEHELPVSPTIGTTADPVAPPPTSSAGLPPASASTSTHALLAHPMAEATIQRQSATSNATAKDGATSFTGANAQLVSENTNATAMQEKLVSSSGTVMADALFDMTDLPGGLSSQPHRFPATPNIDEPAVLPAATLSSALPTALAAPPLPAVPSTESPIPPPNPDQSGPLDSAPVDRAVDSSSILAPLAPLPTAASVETNPLSITQIGEGNLAYSAAHGEAIVAPPQPSVTAPSLSPLLLAVTQRMAQAQRVQRQSLRPESLPMPMLASVQQTVAATVTTPARTSDSRRAGARHVPPPLVIGDIMPLVAPIEHRKAVVAADAITTQPPPAPVAMRWPRFTTPDARASLPADDARESLSFTLPGAPATDDQGGKVVTAPLTAPVVTPVVQRRLNPALAALVSAAEPVIASAAEMITKQVTAPATQNRGEPPDLETLARQVYPLIKRMLAIERERHPVG